VVFVFSKTISSHKTKSDCYYISSLILFTTSDIVWVTQSIFTW